MDRRWCLGAWMLAATAVAAYHGVALTSLAGQNGDDSAYLALAKAIAAGRGYISLGVPGTPPHTMYPPGYPLLLAPVWALGPAWPANLLGFKALNLLAIVLAAAGVYRLATRVHAQPPAIAALAAAITGFSAACSMMVDLTMAELAYMAAVVGALLWIEPRFAAAPGARTGFLAGLLVGAVMAVKTIGFTLGAACAAWLGLNRRWGALAGLAAGGFAALLPWVLWVRGGRTGEASTDYVAWGQQNLGGDLVARLTENVALIATGSLPLAVAPTLRDGRLLALLPGAIAAALLLALWLHLAAGFRATLLPRWRVWHLYLLGFTAFVACFPWHPGRYMSTATPLLALAFAAGCGSLWAWEGRGRGAARLACGVAIALAAAGPLTRTASLIRHGAVGDALLPAREAAALADRRAFAAWARDHLPPDALLLYERPALSYLDTGRDGSGDLEGDRPFPPSLPAYAARPTWVLVIPGSDEYKTRHQALARRFGEQPPAFKGPAGTLEAYRIRVPSPIQPEARIP